MLIDAKLSKREPVANDRQVWLVHSWAATVLVKKDIMIINAPLVHTFKKVARHEFRLAVIEMTKADNALGSDTGDALGYA
jgi:hypothetical protein